MKHTQEEIIKIVIGTFPNMNEEKVMTYINNEVKVDSTHKATKYIQWNDKMKYYQTGERIEQLHNNVETLNILIKKQDDYLNEWVNELVQEYNYKGTPIYNLVEVLYKDNEDKPTFVISLSNGKEDEDYDDEREEVELSYEEIKDIIK